MDFKNLKNLTESELLLKQKELVMKLAELRSNSLLTTMEKPHLKKVYKKSLAQISTLLNTWSK